MVQELRSFKTNVEIRDGTDGRTICGYPIVFNKASEDLGGFIEYVDPKALDGVDMSEVYLIYGHDINQVLARVDSGTLTINVDNKGVYFEASLPHTTLADDVLENIRVGNLKGMSFGFTVKEEDWLLSDSLDSPDVRTIMQIDELFEISLTPMPAYKDTSVAIASRDKSKAAYNFRQRLKDTVTLAKARKELF